MIGELAKVAEVAAKTIKETVGKNGIFDPDRRVNLDQNKTNNKLKTEKFNPDKRLTPERFDGNENKIDSDYNPDRRINAQGELKNIGREEVNVEQTRQHFDDNGNLYREGDHLLPNIKYEVNGYSYNTDDKGRIAKAEGKLRLRDDDYKRNMENVRNKEGQEYEERDEKGHLIGHQFGGSDRLDNLVPMDAQLNHGDFAKLEKTLADAVKAGADVRVKIEPVYENDSMRPAKLNVSYTIDGNRETTVFRNGRVE